MELTFASKIIALIIPEVNSEYYSNIVSRMKNQACKKGYKLLVLETFGSNKKEEAFVNSVKNKDNIDGVIIVKSHNKKPY